MSKDKSVIDYQIKFLFNKGYSPKQIRTRLKLTIGRRLVPSEQGSLYNSFMLLYLSIC